MAFAPHWTRRAKGDYDALKDSAVAALDARKGKGKSTEAEGLFKQVRKALHHLTNDPRQPSLRTHEYLSMVNPFDKSQKVFEAYVQNNTPGAYRIFWCYGPNAKQITITAITPHP